jgi:copper chaperone CopZ
MSKVRPGNTDRATDGRNKQPIESAGGGAEANHSHFADSRAKPPKKAPVADSLLAKLSLFSVLKFSSPVRTVFTAPGRIRFRSDAIVGNTAARDTLVENLHKITGVTSVEVNVTSGSLLIRYEPAEVSPEILFAATLKLLDLEAEFLRGAQPYLAREARAMMGSLNRAVYEMTRGITDFRTFIAVALAVYGIYRVRTDAVRAVPSGFTLLWWAYLSLFGRGEELS